MFAVLNPYTFAPQSTIAMGFTNLDAESGVTGWTNETGTLQSASFVTAHGGTKHFAGSDEAVTQAYQQIDVDAAMHAPIDSGLVCADFSYWECGWTDNTGDTGRCKMAFYNASSVEIGSIDPPITFPSGGSWRQFHATKQIPTGTRKIRVTQHGARTSGTANDYYVDDITANFVINPTQSVPTNGVETGLFLDKPFATAISNTFAGGWTVVSGTAPSIWDFSGTYALFGGSGAVGTTAQYYKSGDIPHSYAAAIDRGAVGISFSWMERRWSSGSGDAGRMTLSFFSAAGVLLGSIGSTVAEPTDTFATRSFSGTLPAGTRVLRVTYYAENRSGSGYNYFVKDVSVKWVT